MYSSILQKIPTDIKNRLGEEDTKRFIQTTLAKNNYRLACDILKYEFLDKGYNVVLHGAGLHSRRVLARLNEGYKKNIIAISDKKRSGTLLDNFLICTPDDCLDLEVDYYILSSDVNQKAMRKELLALGISESKIIDLYQNENLKDYIFFETETIDIVNEINNLPRPITIVSNCVAPKYLRLFRYLKQYFDVTILTSYIEWDDAFNEDFQMFNIKLLDSPVEMVDCVSKINNGVLLTINGVFWNSLGAIETLVSTIPVYSLFIDILSSGFNCDAKLGKYCNAHFEFLAEEILWRYSDGVIFKEHLDLAKINIERYNPKSYIQFLDYCDDQIIVDSDTKIFKNYSFVYAGSLHGDSLDNPDFGHHSTILKVAKTINSLGFKFDIFNVLDKTGFEKSYYLSYKHELYSYNAAVPISKLPHRLCNYDFGVVLFDFSAEGVENLDYYRKGGFSKIMAYIEAEIPIIISKETEFMASLVEKNEIGLAIEFDAIADIGTYLTKENILKWRKNIKKFKMEYSYSKNIETLVGFIEGAIV